MRGSRSLRAAVAGVVALLTGLRALPARAQNASDAAAAEALFDEGKAAMAAHRYADACPKFYESNRLDEGIGTTLWLADCYEKNGQSASAWAQFREAAALAVKSSDPREKVARERAQALEKKLARLILLVPASARLPGLHIARDGGEVGPPLWGSSIPVDPGRHAVVVSAPDHRPQTLTIDIVPGPGEQALTVPLLAEAPPTPSEPVSLVAAPGGPSRPPPPVQRISAVALAAAGVAGVGVASYFGLHAKAKLDDSNTGHCQKNLCDATGVADRSAAQSAATVSTVLFVASGVALASGGVLWWTALRNDGPASPATHSRRMPRIVPWAVTRGGGVVLGNDF